MLLAEGQLDAGLPPDRLICIQVINFLEEFSYVISLSAP
jgi:hypothetical protein